MYTVEKLKKLALFGRPTKEVEAPKDVDAHERRIARRGRFARAKAPVVAGSYDALHAKLQRLGRFVKAPKPYVAGSLEKFEKKLTRMARWA